MSEAKDFLHKWLAKLKIEPIFNIRPAGSKQKVRFICELSVEGYNYVGAGNSTSKKDAQANAAKDFIQYLIRSGSINSNDIPPSIMAITPAVEIPSLLPNRGPGFGSEYPGQTVFEGHRGPQDLGDAYQPRRGGNFKFMMEENARSMEDAEGLDVNSAIHGNWTIQNAKMRLNQYFQLNRIQGDYRYTVIGPDHIRSFQAEMKIWVPELGRHIQGRETGSNKQTASKSCALSLVRQLYHLKVIEPFTGVTKKQKDSGLQPFDVEVDPQVMESVKNFLNENEIQQIVPILKEDKEDLAEEGGHIGLSYILLQDTKKNDPLDLDDSGEKKVGIVSWSPPTQNWNPWTGCNIDEGHMATASLDQLSAEFFEAFKEVQQTNTHVQELNAIRNKLPIYSRKSEILEAISNNPVILIKGETGCGKTTQICQYILDDYILTEQGAYANIIITQPRRISAISVAERVANERGEDLGQTIGYSVRFESCLPRPYAAVLFCTVGVLLRKLEGGLRGVSHLIIDEIHERDVNTDFLLVVIRDMLAIYPDLRVILMSATIDHTLFTNYFNGCPVIYVEGRTFNVNVSYLEDVIEMLKYFPSAETIKRIKRKKKDDEDESEAFNQNEGANNDNLNTLHPSSPYSQSTKQAMSMMNERDMDFELIAELMKYIKSMNVEGAVLVFLPGWNNIFGLLKYLEQHPLFGSGEYCILPLHSQIPREDQHRVFRPVPQGVTKIILSTNIAETSITIDDVVFVIDLCKSKTKMFTSHNNMTTFITSWASKSNLAQRRGRAGRVREGYCYHFCSRARFDSLEENMTAEMFRTPLHEIALTIKLLRLGSIGHFLSKAPEPPPLDAVIEAQVILKDLNCLDEIAELTPLGRILAKLPVDPRLGKMIVLGTIFNCADPMAIIAAQSSNMSEIFTIGLESKKLLPTQRSFGASLNSDHFACINAFQQWEGVKNKKGDQGEIEFCEQRVVSLPSLRTTCDAKNQLLQVLSVCGFPDEQLTGYHIKFQNGNPILDIIAALLCTGLYPNVCYHKGKRKVWTTENKMALVHKASINCTRFDIVYPFPFFIYGEKIRTRAIACKNMTNVTPIHLLLFGCKRVETIGQMIVIDKWINLHMNIEDAAAILSLRPLVEDMVLSVSENPEGFFPLSKRNEDLVGLIVKLSKLVIPDGWFPFGPQSGPSTNWSQSAQPRSSLDSSNWDNEGESTEFNEEIGMKSFNESNETPLKRTYDASSEQQVPSKFSRGAGGFRGNQIGNSGFRGNQPFHRGGGAWTPRPSFSTRGQFRGDFGGNRPRFFSTNRGGWNSRGNPGRGRFMNRGPMRGNFRGRSNYQY